MNRAILVLLLLIANAIVSTSAPHKQEAVQAQQVQSVRLGAATLLSPVPAATGGKSVAFPL